MSASPSEAGRGVPAVDPSHLRSFLVTGVRIASVTGAPGGAGVGAGVVDVRVEGGVVAEIGVGLSPRGAEVHDGGGRWAVPGLWDAHAHLGQWVQGSLRLDTSGTTSPEDVLSRVVAELPGLPPGATLQGWGHRSAGWARQGGVAELDAVSGDHPVVLVSGDAHHAWVNSAALRLLRLPPREGAVTEAEWFDAFPRLFGLPGVADETERRYADVVAAANARGVVGVVDMEFGVDGFVDWPRRFAGDVAPGARAVDTLRVRTATYEVGLRRVLDAGLSTGQLLPGGGGLLEMGPLKVISDGSLNTRTAYCCEPYVDAADLEAPLGVQNVPPEHLRALLTTARAAGLEAAFHAIGDAAVRDVLDAFGATGAAGSVEHAQLLRWEDVPRMARLGVRASIQPHHQWDDRDVADRCWPDRGDRCFAWRALADAGVPLRLGSDAPVSPLDPWLAMAAAVHRSADARDPWHPEQSLSLPQALAASTDGVGRVAVGAPGDLVLLDADPLAPAGLATDTGEVAAALLAMPVAATFVAGRLVHAS